MTELLLDHWLLVAASIYVGGFVSFALWELARPRRDWTSPTVVRWSNNFAAFAVSAASVQLLLPMLTVGFAGYVDARGWGLFNQVAVADYAAIGLSLLAIDLARYGEHRLLHGVPLLWRFHRMHHVDPDFDVTTGLRTHPLEALFSALVRMAVIAALGIPLVAALLAELALVATNFFIHVNARIPPGLDRRLRKVMVTPDFHRVHHSVDYREGNSNFANVLPLWDHLFGTHVPQPALGHTGMVIGLPGFTDRKHLLLPWMMLNPILKEDASRPGIAAGAGDSLRADGVPGSS